MTRSALVRVASLVIATTACQQCLPTRSHYTKWLNEEVVYIITDRQRAEFLKLTTDAQRDKFIERFWRYRDPPPGALEHSAKAEHYRRMHFANEHFGTASGTPGLEDGSRAFLYYVGWDLLLPAWR